MSNASYGHYDRLTDSNVSVQTSGNNTGDQGQDIPNILPGLLAYTLVRQRESELTLEGIHKCAVHQVGNANEQLSAYLVSQVSIARLFEQK